MAKKKANPKWYKPKLYTLRQIREDFEIKIVDASVMVASDPPLAIKREYRKELRKHVRNDAGFRTIPNIEKEVDNIYQGLHETQKTLLKNLHGCVQFGLMRDKNYIALCEYLTPYALEYGIIDKEGKNLTDLWLAAFTFMTAAQHETNAFLCSDDTLAKMVRQIRNDVKFKRIKDFPVMPKRLEIFSLQYNKGKFFNYDDVVKVRRFYGG
tara:strand:- start:1861 stop:2490 length:630 start_codon:yes stop_codon:yes gene_type:complete